MEMMSNKAGGAAAPLGGLPVSSFWGLEGPYGLHRLQPLCTIFPQVHKGDILTLAKRVTF